MIYEIVIKDLERTENYAYGPKNNFDLWISAVDSDDRHKVERIKKLFKLKDIKHCVRYFYDWSDEDNDRYIQQHIEKVGPTFDDIQSIISFLTPYIEDEKIHKLGINCFAGISRSTAIGIIALVMSGKAPQSALDYILAIRPEAWPNLRILRLATRILGVDILTPVAKWKANCKSLYLPKE